MTIYLVSAFIVMFACAIGFAMSTAFLYGGRQSDFRYIKSLVRDRKKLTRDLMLWQDVVAKRSGFGTVHTKKERPPDPETSKQVRFVSAGQLIARQKAEEEKRMPTLSTPPTIQKNAIPQKVADAFLAETKPNE